MYGNQKCSRSYSRYDRNARENLDEVEYECWRCRICLRPQVVGIERFSQRLPPSTVQRAVWMILFFAGVAELWCEALTKR